MKGETSSNMVIPMEICINVSVKIRLQCGFLEELSFYESVSPLWALPFLSNRLEVSPHQFHTTYIAPTTIPPRNHYRFSFTLSNHNHLIRITVINSYYHCWLKLYHCICKSNRQIVLMNIWSKKTKRKKRNCVACIHFDIYLGSLVFD